MEVTCCKIKIANVGGIKSKRWQFMRTLVSGGLALQTWVLSVCGSGTILDGGESSDDDGGEG